MYRCLIFFLAFILFITTSSIAQRDEQLWLDVQVDYPFRGQYLFEVTAGYQTVFSPDIKWRAVSVTPTFEYMGFRWLDFTFDLPMGYTTQSEDLSSAEIVPTLGLRFHITQNRRINSRIITRVEQRFFHQQEADDWDRSSRVRLKAEVVIAINRPNLFNDKLWYAILDYEEFLVLDQQLEERFANRRRGRIGFGYRMNYKNRVELIYARQSSRNEIKGEFISDDNIIQLKYKIFLNPSKPVAN